MKFIDIHGHYAWNVDDGIPNKEDAYTALKMAKENGIVGIVATPHLVCGKHDKEHMKMLKSRINDLSELAKEFDISVFQGCELFLNDECYEQLDQDLVIPFENTKYLLCEFDVRKKSHSQEEFEDRLYEVDIKGYTPIVAHVERYFKKAIDIDRVAELVDNGYVIQVNSTSILGLQGKTCQENVYALLKNNLVHCIASDTHTVEGSRCPNLKKTYELLAKDFSKEDLNKLFYTNPLAILKNEEVEKTQYVKKGFFNKLLKRRS